MKMKLIKTIQTYRRDKAVEQELYRRSFEQDQVFPLSYRRSDKNPISVNLVPEASNAFIDAGDSLRHLTPVEINEIARNHSVDFNRSFMGDIFSTDLSPKPRVARENIVNLIGAYDTLIEKPLLQRIGGK